jgi:hypothetical protein
MRDTARIEDKNDDGGSESLSSTSAVLTTPPVMDPADLLKNGLKNQKMVHVLLSEEKKHATMRKCRVC